MLTNKDIDKLKGTFSTKEDLKQFATKEDLKQFATKEDLKQFATKEDLKQFATKEDLRKSAEETKRHFNVVAEDLKNSITILAESVSAKNNKIDEHEKAIEDLKTDVSVLNGRISMVEANPRK